MLDTEGVLLPADVDDPITFSLSGRPVWSFTPRRDGVQHQHGTWVPWPPVLRPYLDGVADVRLATADGTRELLDTRVRFGDSGRAVEVLDASGHPLIIDKVGHLSRAFADTADTVRREILRGTRRAIEDLREHAGVAAYLNYGALLGAVRDGAMISHDSDTDVCYLSRHAHPVDLVAESYRVERAMRARGWNLLRMSGGDVKLLLPLSDGRTCHIDVFVAFHVGETFYHLGNRSGTLPREAIVPFSTVTLDGLDFPAPADPEAMLAFLYGPRWRVPDPSFRYDDPPAGVRRLDGWLRGFRSSMGRWTEFYQSPAGSSLPREPSDFAAWVEATLPAGEPVAELGCGTGRDAAALARAGRSVVALDYNRVARRRTNRRAQREGLDLRTRMLLLGDLRSVLLSAAEIHHERRHVVARLSWEPWTTRRGATCGSWPARPCATAGRSCWSSPRRLPTTAPPCPTLSPRAWCAASIPTASWRRSPQPGAGSRHGSWSGHTTSSGSWIPRSAGSRSPGAHRPPSGTRPTPPTPRPLRSHPCHRSTPGDRPRVRAAGGVRQAGGCPGSPAGGPPRRG